MSPRREASAFSNYYTKSASSKFWGTHFYKQTEEARREKLWKPKALQVAQNIAKYSSGCDWVADIGGGYGVFGEEFKRLTGTEVVVIEPSPSMAKVCESKKLKVLNCFFEEV